ncbi:MAG: hypothetical protein LBJ80_02790 [Rickettsiales bacterium]|jgi:hypothetical protein|nr:hypothetical protein [Rickettsiales bacterium]MDR1261325.1 hypothetical protein [Rickettsiales bacterium]
MTEVKDTPQTGVEKKFKDVFERSPGPFPEGASLDDKVKIIAKLNRELKAQKGRIAEGSVERRFKDIFGRSPGPFPEGASSEDKVKTIAKLNQKLESRKSHAAEKVHQDFERIAELDRQYKGKGIFRSEKVAGPKSDKELQDTSKKPTAEGKSFEQSGQKETSVQPDTQLSVNAEVQTPSGPKLQAVGFSSMSISPIREKFSDKKPGLNKEDNVPQENQKEEGLFSLLKRFVKKVLEKLLGEDKKSVEDAYNMKGATQRDVLDNEAQQQGKHFDKILNQDQSIGKGLKQVATQLENSTITPVNTPGVDKINAGRER